MKVVSAAEFKRRRRERDIRAAERIIDRGETLALTKRSTGRDVRIWRAVLHLLLAERNRRAFQEATQ